MAQKIVQNSIKGENLRAKSPTGEWFDGLSVEYTAENGQGRYVVVGKTFTSVDNGDWELFTSDTVQILNDGNKAVAGNTKIGIFRVNIPTPTGTVTTPTITLISVVPAEITTAGYQEVVVTVQITP